MSKDEYKNMISLIGTALPSMAVAVVKHDENGQPYQVKYQICVLGNLDLHKWSKRDCYAPDMSQLEFRILLSEACKKRCHLRTGDFEQAFCQSILLQEEQYVVCPPKGCFITPPNTSILLKKTLYGLKRSPHHWYMKAKQVLNDLGLHECKNVSCIFQGCIQG
mmetsp:Transcript_17053/g.24126  ORF Transcript_17053/g.24126 Transcript_17053/m.24126 type:complete len:163 (-) Transcript_17053:645-1133(-)